MFESGFVSKKQKENKKKFIVTFLCHAFLKVGLHYSNYCTKLVHFEAQKIFSMLKSHSFDRFALTLTYIINSNNNSNNSNSKLRARGSIIW